MQTVLPDQEGPSEGTANEKLEGKIVNALGVFLVIGLLGLNPAVNEAVAHGKRGAVVVIVIGGGVNVF